MFLRFLSSRESPELHIKTAEVSSDYMWAQQKNNIRHVQTPSTRIIGIPLFSMAIIFVSDIANRIPGSTTDSGPMPVVWHRLSSIWNCHT